MRIILFIAACIAASPVHAEVSPHSTGDYYYDLGQVHGAALYIKQYQEVCSPAFPDLRRQNDHAYAEWSKKYNKFYQELESHWNASLWKEAEGDPKKHAEVLQQVSVAFAGLKQQLRGQLTENGPAGFRKACSHIRLTKRR